MGMSENYKNILVSGLKHYHDCSFTPGVYGHSIIGQAALLLEKSEEVVRCKDCIGKAHWYKNNYGCTICGLSGLFVVEDRDFCSYGERREGE